MALGSPDVFYRMDEASGNLTDASGNGYTGTAQGTPTYGETGVINDAIKCAGSGSPSANRFDISGLSGHADTLSVSMWIKKDTAGDGFGFMTNADTGSSTAGINILYLEGAGLWATKVVDNGYTGGPTYAKASDNDWHHIVVTFDDPDIKLWIDNVNVASGTWDGRDMSGTTFEVFSGDGTSTGTYLMDLVGIWKNYVLTSGDVSSLYNSGSGYDPTSASTSRTKIEALGSC